MQSIWVGIVIAAAASIYPVNAQPLEAGKNEYVKSCQSCHTGQQARGTDQGLKVSRRAPLI